MTVAALALAVLALLVASATAALVWWLSRPIDDGDPWERQCRGDRGGS